VSGTDLHNTTAANLLSIALRSVKILKKKRGNRRADEFFRINYYKWRWSEMYEDITENARAAMEELLDNGRFRAGDIVAVGCSSSEIMGERIGKGSTPEAAQAVVAGIMPVIEAHGGLLAAQCCEHLNRALVVERTTAEKYGYDVVCVRPRPKAGGSFATAVYEYFRDPVVVEHVRATAGLDIGSTLDRHAHARRGGSHAPEGEKRGRGLGHRRVQPPQAHRRRESRVSGMRDKKYPAAKCSGFFILISVKCRTRVSRTKTSAIHLVSLASF
jgi:uncharacterized protein (TIGR01440 family)